MNVIKYLLCSVLCLACFTDVSARSYKDTLSTTSGDRVIITYDVSYTDNQYTVRFNNARKILGSRNASVYKDPDKVALMFFDKTGNFPKDITVTGMVPEAMMIPSGVTYDFSPEGYFVVQDSPAISFRTKASSVISIPICLAYHPKRGKYEVFAKCRPLKIRLSSSPSSAARKQGGQSTYMGNDEQTTTITTEEEAGNEAEIKILESIGLVKTMLISADKLPFSESLVDEVSFLRNKKRDITDGNLVQQINDALELYEAKKAELEQKADAAQLAAQQDAEKRAADAANAEQARNDSIQKAQQLAAEQDKRNNIWMIVGGVVMAVLAFVGNQLFQNYRNNRNQKNMEAMQKSMSDKAEAEARRMARRAENQARRAAADSLKGGQSSSGMSSAGSGMGKKGKSNKYSI